MTYSEGGAGVSLCLINGIAQRNMFCAESCLLTLCCWIRDLRKWVRLAIAETIVSMQTLLIPPSSS